MKRGFKNLVVVGLFLMLVSAAGLVLAQETAAPKTNSLTATNCFDYYKFGSVTASVTPNLQEIGNGGQLDFVFNLKNENAYPVVEGILYVKIYQRQTDSKLAVKNGGLLVDGFIAKDKISIDGGATKSIEYSWQVPALAPTGVYDVYTYFLSAKKLNLLGLPFTDDITGGSNSFKITSDAGKAVVLNKNKVTLNGKAFQFVGAPVVISKDEKATFKIPLDNPTKEKQTVKVTYELYSWSGIEDSQRLTARSETIELKPGESKILTYEAGNTSYPVYLLSVKAKWENFSSMLEARFARSGIERGRINFAGINKFPLSSGGATPVFACIHNAALGTKTAGKLKLEILDQEYNVLGEYSYSGDVTGAMMGLKADFTSPSNLGQALLRATLSDDQGKMVDQASLNYDCREIDPQKCPAGSTPPPSTGGPKVDMMWIIVGGAIIIIVIVIVIIMAKRKKGIPPPGTPISNAPTPIQKGPSAGMMAIILGATLASLLAALPAEAKSVDYRVTEGGFGTIDTVPLNIMFNTLVLDSLNINYRVTYKATAVDTSNNQVIDDTDGIDSVQTGKTIRLSYDTNDFTIAAHNIEWLEIGNIFGTPYGHWDRDGNGSFTYPYGSLVQACSPDDQMTLRAEHQNSPGNFWDTILFAPFVVIEPTKTALGQGATCTPVAGRTEFNCVVNGSAGQPGSVNITFGERDGRHFIEGKDNISVNCGTTMGRTWFNDVQIPTQTISFPFNIVGAANPGNTLEAPIVTGDAWARRNANVNLRARVETNPPADSIRYTFQRRAKGTNSYSNIGARSATYPNYASLTTFFSNNGTYLINARARNTVTGVQSAWGPDFEVVISDVPPQNNSPQCSNGIDDDGDGLADTADPGCHIGNDPTRPYDPTDPDEDNPPSQPAACIVGAPKKAIGTCSASCGPGVQVYENYISVNGMCEIQFTTEPCNLRACGSIIHEGNPGGQ